LSARRETPPFWTPRKRRVLWTVLAIVVLDQALLWTFLTRPVNGIRSLIELTGRADPPYFQLQPRLVTTYSSWRLGAITNIHINALGFRDRERPVDRPPGVRRVLVTGDSITFGIGVEDDDAFPEQLQAQLEEKGRTNIEVWNAGVPGYAMADHLGNLRRRLLPLHPDAIVLQLGRNDSAVPMPLSPAFLTSLRFSGLARAWMIVRFNFLEDAGLFDASFRSYVDECRRAGVRLLVWSDGLPHASEAETRRVAAEGGVPIIGTGTEDYPKLPDDPHYAPEGNRRIAERLLPEVLALLGDAPP
jgi:lysophospholipase L1-like esterase